MSASDSVGAEVRNNPQWLKLLGPETDPLDGWRHPDKRMMLAAVDPIIDSLWRFALAGRCSQRDSLTTQRATRV